MNMTMPRIMRNLIASVSIPLLATFVLPSQSYGAEFIGRMNDNPFDPESCANEFSACGNPFSPTSPKNPFGRYGNPYSPYSGNNPYATDAPRLYGHADE